MENPPHDGHDHDGDSEARDFLNRFEGLSWNIILDELDREAPSTSSAETEQTGTTLHMHAGVLSVPNPYIYTLNPSDDDVTLFKCAKCNYVLKRESFPAHLRVRHELPPGKSAEQLLAEEAAAQNSENSQNSCLDLAEKRTLEPSASSAPNAAQVLLSEPSSSSASRDSTENPAPVPSISTTEEENSLPLDVVSVEVEAPVSEARKASSDAKPPASKRTRRSEEIVLPPHSNSAEPEPSSLTAEDVSRHSGNTPTPPAYFASDFERQATEIREDYGAAFTRPSTSKEAEQVDATVARPVENQLIIEIKEEAHDPSEACEAIQRANRTVGSPTEMRMLNMRRIVDQASTSHERRAELERQQDNAEENQQNQPPETMAEQQLQHQIVNLLSPTLNVPSVEAMPPPFPLVNNHQFASPQFGSLPVVGAGFLSPPLVSSHAPVPQSQAPAPAPVVVSRQLFSEPPLTPAQATQAQRIMSNIQMMSTLQQHQTPVVPTLPTVSQFQMAANMLNGMNMAAELNELAAASLRQQLGLASMPSSSSGMQYQQPQPVVQNMQLAQSFLTFGGNQAAQLVGAPQPMSHYESFMLNQLANQQVQFMDAAQRISTAQQQQHQQMPTLQPHAMQPPSTVQNVNSIPVVSVLEHHLAGLEAHTSAAAAGQQLEFDSMRRLSQSDASTSFFPNNQQLSFLSHQQLPSTSSATAPPAAVPAAPLLTNSVFRHDRTAPGHIFRPYPHQNDPPPNNDKENHADAVLAPQPSVEQTVEESTSGVDTATASLSQLLNPSEEVFYGPHPNPNPRDIVTPDSECLADIDLRSESSIDIDVEMGSPGPEIFAASSEEHAPEAQDHLPTQEPSTSAEITSVPQSSADFQSSYFDQESDPLQDTENAPGEVYANLLPVSRHGVFYANNPPLLPSYEVVDTDVPYGGYGGYAYAAYQPRAAVQEEEFHEIYERPDGVEEEVEVAYEEEVFGSDTEVDAIYVEQNAEEDGVDLVGAEPSILVTDELLNAEETSATVDVELCGKQSTEKVSVKVVSAVRTTTAVQLFDTEETSTSLDVELFGKQSTEEVSGKVASAVRTTTTVQLLNTEENSTSVDVELFRKQSAEDVSEEVTRPVPTTTVAFFVEEWIAPLQAELNEEESGKSFGVEQEVEPSLPTTDERMDVEKTDDVTAKLDSGGQPVQMEIESEESFQEVHIPPEITTTIDLAMVRESCQEAQTVTVSVPERSCGSPLFVANHAHAVVQELVDSIANDAAIEYDGPLVDLRVDLRTDVLTAVDEPNTEIAKILRKTMQKWEEFGDSSRGRRPLLNAPDSTSSNTKEFDGNDYQKLLDTPPHPSATGVDEEMLYAEPLPKRPCSSRSLRKVQLVGRVRNSRRRRSEGSVDGEYMLGRPVVTNREAGDVSEAAPTVRTHDYSQYMSNYLALAPDEDEIRSKWNVLREKIMRESKIRPVRQRNFFRQLALRVMEKWRYRPEYDYPSLGATGKWDFEAELRRVGSDDERPSLRHSSEVWHEIIRLAMELPEFILANLPSHLHDVVNNKNHWIRLMCSLPQVSSCDVLSKLEEWRTLCVYMQWALSPWRLNMLDKHQRHMHWRSYVDRAHLATQWHSMIEKKDSCRSGNYDVDLYDKVYEKMRGAIWCRKHGRHPYSLKRLQPSDRHLQNIHGRKIMDPFSGYRVSFVEDKQLVQTRITTVLPPPCKCVQMGTNEHGRMNTPGGPVHLIAARRKVTPPCKRCSKDGPSLREHDKVCEKWWKNKCANPDSQELMRELKAAKPGGLRPTPIPVRNKTERRKARRLRQLKSKGHFVRDPREYSLLRDTIKAVSSTAPRMCQQPTSVLLTRNDNVYRLDLHPNGTHMVKRYNCAAPVELREKEYVAAKRLRIESEVGAPEESPTPARQLPRHFARLAKTREILEKSQQRRTATYGTVMADSMFPGFVKHKDQMRHRVRDEDKEEINHFLSARSIESVIRERVRLKEDAVAAFPPEDGKCCARHRTHLMRSCPMPAKEFRKRKHEQNNRKAMQGLRTEETHLRRTWCLSTKDWWHLQMDEKLRILRSGLPKRKLQFTLKLPPFPLPPPRKYPFGYLLTPKIPVTSDVEIRMFEWMGFQRHLEPERVHEALLILYIRKLLASKRLIEHITTQELLRAIRQMHADYYARNLKTEVDGQTNAAWIINKVTPTDSLLTIDPGISMAVVRAPTAYTVSSGTTIVELP